MEGRVVASHGNPIAPASAHVGQRQPSKALAEQSRNRPFLAVVSVVTNTSSVLVRALIAYSVHEHQEGAATRVVVTLAPHSCTVEDDGRGMGLDRDGYVSGLLEQLSARQGEVALHGIGLAIVAMSVPLMTVESRRAGRRFTQSYSWGQADGPVRSEPADEATGTLVAFSLSNDAPEIDASDVLEQVQVWRTAHPNLQLDVEVVA